MTDPKPKPRRTKLELREPAKPLTSPRPLADDHPAAQIFREAQNSQPILSSQPTEQPRASPVGNQPVLDDQPKASSQPILSHQVFNLATAIPDVKGDTRLPHKYSDYLCTMLKPDEQAVFLQLYRLSWGFKNETCFISNPRLSKRSNVPLSSMKRAVSGLISKGVVEKTGQTNGFGKEQGVEYKVLNLDWQPILSSQPDTSSQPNMGTIKDKDFKERF